MVATDIQSAPWLDCVADAQRLPFARGCAANIVMVDVLHHLEFPLVFFREAERVLRPGGRVIMVEPAITWGSSCSTGCFITSRFEPRPTSCSTEARIRTATPMTPTRPIPTLLATRDRERFHRLCPALRIAGVEWFSFAAYPLSGGFKPWSLVGEGVARRMLRVERAIEPVLGRFTAFRMMLIVEKGGGPG